MQKLKDTNLADFQPFNFGKARAYFRRNEIS